MSDSNNKTEITKEQFAANEIKAFCEYVMHPESDLHKDADDWIKERLQANSINVPKELKQEAKKKAKELFELNEQTSQTNDAYKGALITVKEMLNEHSCYTLNDNRWSFWAQVEIELNGL